MTPIFLYLLISILVMTTEGYAETTHCPILDDLKSLCSINASKNHAVECRPPSTPNHWMVKNDGTSSNTTITSINGFEFDKAIYHANPEKFNLYGSVECSYLIDATVDFRSHPMPTQIPVSYNTTHQAARNPAEFDPDHWEVEGIDGTQICTQKDPANCIFSSLDSQP